MLGLSKSENPGAGGLESNRARLCATLHVSMLSKLTTTPLASGTSHAELPVSGKPRPCLPTSTLLSSLGSWLHPHHRALQKCVLQPLHPRWITPSAGIQRGVFSTPGEHRHCYTAL